MTNTKQVSALPRFLLPPVALSGNSSRIPASSLLVTGVPTTQAHRSVGLFFNAFKHGELHRSLYHTSGLSGTGSNPIRESPSTNPISYPVSAQQYIPLLLNSRPKNSNSLNSSGAPIKHNGVYVAVFKPAQRAFHASPVSRRDHHFDTLKIVQRLKGEGFSEEQAVALMRVLNNVIEESIQNLTRTMVLKEGMLAG